MEFEDVDSLKEALEFNRAVSVCHILYVLNMYMYVSVCKGICSKVDNFILCKLQLILHEFLLV